MDYRVRYTKSAPEFIRVEIQTRKAYGRVDSFDTADELLLSWFLATKGRLQNGPRCYLFGSGAHR